MKLTFGQVKEAVARPLGFTTTDSRLVDYVNRAVERLIEGMKSKGTVVRYRVCASNSCLVLPRQLENVEAFAIDKVPGVVRNNWYEFLGGGPGVQEDDSEFSNQLILGDEAASFDNVTGTGKKLAVYSDVTEAATGYIILQFYDANGQWVRTQSSGQWIDGEKLTLPAAGNYVYTTNECMADGFVAAIKTATNGTIRLYEYTVSNGNLKALAFYEHDEIIPRYRSILIPGLTTVAANDGGDCAKKTLVLQGKARFVPVANDNDFLQIESVEAIRLACQAIAKEEKDLLVEADTYWYGRVDPTTGRRKGGAFGVLDAQLEHWQGHGARQPLVMEDRLVGGPAVLNMV